MDLFVRVLEQCYTTGGEKAIMGYIQRKVFYEGPFNSLLLQNPNAAGRAKVFTKASILFAAALVTRDEDRRVYYLRNCIHRFQESLFKEPHSRSMAKERYQAATAVFGVVEDAIGGNRLANQLVQDLPTSFLAGDFSFVNATDATSLDYGDDCGAKPDKKEEEQTGLVHISDNHADSYLDPVTKKRRKVLHGHDKTQSRMILSQMSRAKLLAESAKGDVLQMLRDVRAHQNMNTLVTTV